MLPDHGFVCDVVDPGIDLTVADNLRNCLQGYAAVIAGSEPYPAEVIE